MIIELNLHYIIRCDIVEICVVTVVTDCRRSCMVSGGVHISAVSGTACMPEEDGQG